MPAQRLDRNAALAALRDASTAAGVRSTELTVEEYRRYRAASRMAHVPRPPSDLAITLLFGSWTRACAEARSGDLRPIMGD